MTPSEAIRRCATVAECHTFRASLGEMDSATTAVFLARVAALRKKEGAEAP